MKSEVSVKTCPELKDALVALNEINKNKLCDVENESIMKAVNSVAKISYKTFVSLPPDSKPNNR